MIRVLIGALVFLFALTARAQIQVDLKFARLQYIAYEPVLATVTITNLAGRDVELRDDYDQHWYGFDITGNEERTLAPLPRAPEPPLQIRAGTSVTRKINLTPLFPITDLGTYHVRANVFFADLNKFFYARPKVIEITNARPIWQRTVGDPDGAGVRTFSLMSNRFPDHTSLYVRVEDRTNSLVYATYSLGRVIAFDEPHAEIDRQNQLHVLHCSAPRVWTYSIVSPNGRLLKHLGYAEVRGMPRLRRSGDGKVTVSVGVADLPAAPSAAGRAAARLSDRPAQLPPGD